MNDQAHKPIMIDPRSNDNIPDYGARDFYRLIYRGKDTISRHMYRDHLILREYDPCPISPLEDMRYGKITIELDKYEGVNQHGEKAIIDQVENTIYMDIKTPLVWLPIYYSDGSGITFSTYSSKLWYPRCCGVATIEEEEIKKAYNLDEVTEEDIKEARDVIESTLGNYGMYLSGLMMLFAIYNLKGELVEVIGGYTDQEDMLKDAMVIIDEECDGAEHE